MIGLLLLLLVLPLPGAASNNQDSLDQYLRLSSAAGFSGVVLVTSGNHIVLQKGYGMADRSAKVSNAADTPSAIGSITKHFTAAAILKLEMQGKLRTDDPITKFFPNVPPDKAALTVHHLLSHTSGIPENFGGDYETALRDETIRRILETPLDFEPGKDYSYSNAGYSVLAAIIEIVSGKSYEAYLSENLFRPAGMQKTGYRFPRWKKQRMMHGYVGPTDNGTPLDKNWSDAGPYWNLLGNGGLISTVGDLYRWKRTLQTDAVLSQQAKEKMFTAYAQDYGYGATVTQTKLGMVVGHGGANDWGLNAAFHWYIDRDATVIVLSNSGDYQGSGPTATLVGVKLGEILFGDQQLPRMKRKIVSVPLTLLKKYEGTYRLPAGGSVVVRVSEGSLSAEPVGQEAVDAFLGPSEKDRGLFQRLSANSSRLVEEISRNDFAFLKEVTDEKRYERYRDYLRRSWQELQQEKGAYQGYRILGTTTTWWDRQDWLATIVQLRFQEGEQVFRFHWREGKLVGIGGQAIRSPAATSLLPVSTSEFIGWHLGIAVPIPVRFEESPADMSMQLVLGSIRAIRE